MVLDTKNNKGIKDKICFSDVLSVAGKITGVIAGFDPNDVADAFKKDGFLKTLHERKDIDKRIEEYIDKLLPEGCDRLLIIIDELDRCNPKFAMRLLEQIKHYFNNERITFVFSVNLVELQHTVKQYYGKDFNASRYLDSFFDLRVSLPPPDINKFFELIQFYDERGTVDLLMKYVFKKYNMQMRDCTRYLSILKAVKYRKGYDFTAELNNTERIIVKIILPIIWGIMVTDIQKYNDFVSGKDYSELLNILSDRELLSYLNRELALLYEDGYFGQLNVADNIEDLHQRLKNFCDRLILTREYGSIGVCKFGDVESDFFFQTLSLLSNNTMLRDM